MLIWYEVPDLSAADQAALFSMLNTGKIALTDAELIRALLLERRAGWTGPVPDTPETSLQRLHIADRWDDMEQGLQDEVFWKFLTGGRVGERAASSPTRLDFILQILALQINRSVLSDADRAFPDGAPWGVPEEANREYFSFFVLSAWLKLLQRQNASGSVGDDGRITVWDSLCGFFRMVRCWYEDTLCYHRIGFLTATSSRPVTELMTKSPKFITKEKLAAQALHIMESHTPKPITVLPVLDEERHVIGLLHMTDLVRQSFICLLSAQWSSYPEAPFVFAKVTVSVFPLRTAEAFDFS